jgi:antagonist of KipI
MLRVLAPGLLTTVQDAGRPALAALGVPQAGACDPWAAAAANALVGNPPGAPVLEITGAGAELQAEVACAVGLAGADLGASVDGEHALAPGGSYFLREGSVLAFRGRRRGLRAYLAPAGGIAAPVVLGAAATYVAGGFGGLDGSGRPLRAGDRLAPAAPPAAPLARAGRAWPADPTDPAYDDAPELRVLAGPHAAYFAPGTWETLCAAAWEVTEQSDRMGLRLGGPRLAWAVPGQGELLSQGVPWGALQVPPDGRPILLLADHQTVGGYPVIGVVARADWPLAAQAPPGATIRFRPCTLGEAQAAFRAQAAALAAAAAALAAAAAADPLARAGWAELGALGDGPPLAETPPPG